MELVAAQSEKRTDRTHKLSFGHVEATIHKAEQPRTSAGTRAPVRISLYCDQAHDALLSPQQLAGAAQGDCARRGAGRGAVQSRYRPLCDISANHRGRCPLFRIEPSTATARNAAEIEGAIAAIAREPGGGVVQIPDSFTLTHREPIVRVIAHHRLPAVYSNNSHQVRSGHQPQGALGLAVPSPSPQKDLWIAAGALVANRGRCHVGS
jgi:hypothetical protein